MASGSAPSIKEDPRTCVAHAWGSEALSDLPDLKYSSYYTKMKKVKTGTGASSFPRWQWAAIPRVVPGPASCIRSSYEAISNAHSQVPPSADPGEGSSKRAACNSPAGLWFLCNPSFSQAQLVRDLCLAREGDEVITCAKCFPMREDTS